MKTHIYISVSSAEIHPGDRSYGYVITAEGHSKKIQSVGFVNGTYHQASLQAITEAIARFDSGVDCEMEIHSEDRWVAYHAVNSLEQHWQFHGWLNSKGEEIKNKRLWELLYHEMQVSAAKITWTKGRHKYSDYLRRAMRDAENEKREMPV